MQVKAEHWERLVRRWPKENWEQLRELLEETIRCVENLLGTGKDVRRTLRKLMSGA